MRQAKLESVTDPDNRSETNSLMLPRRVENAKEPARAGRVGLRSKARYAATILALSCLAIANSMWSLRDFPASIQSRMNLLMTRTSGILDEALENLADETEWRTASLIPEPATNETEKLLHYTAKSRAPIVEVIWTDSVGPDVEIRFYDDAASLNLVEKYRPHFVETYTTQLSPVERADYFRYLVLWAFGGVYVDSDVIVLKPIDQWLASFGWDRDHRGWKLLNSLDLVVGVEFPMPQVHYNETGWLPLQLTQFVIAGSKRSPALERIIDHIERCVASVDREGDVERTLQRTGPAAFTRAIVDEIQARGLISSRLLELRAERKVDKRHPHALLPNEELHKSGQLIPLRQVNESGGYDHILVLPYRAFAFHSLHEWAKGPELTVHRFQNSWRQSS